MRKSIGALLLAATGAIATPVYAITGNWVEDQEHPFVGLVVFYDAAGQFIWRCSGSLISPTKLLTAGHCTDTAEGASSARVYFQQDAGAHFDPATQRDPITHDVGLVILDQPIAMPEYGQLPQAGVLDSLATARGKRARNDR